VFFDTIGFFDRSKRFWTGEPFPAAEAIRTGMIRELRRFNPNLTVINYARSGSAQLRDALQTPGCKSRPAEPTDTLVAGVIGLHNRVRIDQNNGRPQP
jgi:hypothetical protein